MRIYHDASEREPIKDGDGDNSRSQESNELAGISQARFLVNVHDCLGLNYADTLDSSIALIEAMLQEFIYVQREKKLSMKKGTDENGENYEWVELPSFDDPTKTIRYKKYYDIGGKINLDE